MKILLPVYNRYEYLKECLETLLRTDYIDNNFELIISNDNSTDKRVIELINNFKFNISNMKVKVVNNKVNLGANKHFIYLLTNYIQDDKYIILLNDDMIFNPNWLLTMINYKNKIKDDIGILTVFNTKTHQFTESYNPNVGIKDVVGFCCVMIHRDIIKHNKMINSDGQNIDWIASEVCKELKLKIYSTYNSYVNHIGYIGTNKHLDGSIDVAENFLKY